MAALVFSLVGASAGAAFGPAGALVGRLAGAVAGSVIDHALFGSRAAARHVEGPRLADLDVMASTEGAPIQRIYGLARVSGQVIWATELEEVITTRNESGGKGSGGSPTSTTYSYFANIAVALCEGPIRRVRRVWADGKLLDLTGIDMRVHDGSEAQDADPLIVAREGEAPAYRGTAYVVFERLPLEKFGNRIPQLSFEVSRPVGRLEPMVRAVTLIPGTTEFGYEPSAVVRIVGPGQFEAENRHVAHADSDVIASLDDLQAACPNLERVAIVVAWFGTDLRAGHCIVKPGIESPGKVTHPETWSVAGLVRDDAHVISLVEDRPAYGGTPSDASVVNLITELKERGLQVTLYPFVMMDVPADNELPDPWTGNEWQPPYPWRGRITCDPASGQPDSPDGTATAAEQVDAFFGVGDPEGWNYRRMVLHYMEIAAEAGGVDAFLIGSELRGLTRVRSASGVYPAVTRLKDLADEVKADLGSETIVTYGADWTEYGAHVVDADASEVRFPLDALWSADSIDVVGVDYYAPLADWRDGGTHLDRAIASSIYDLDYLAGNLRAGDAYDWYYPDADARNAQARSPITDGLGKPWIYRVKDFWNWWSNEHYERVGGAELASPTAWVPQGKPIWLTELGCPAVDKGANAPNVFPDPKSAEGGVPHFSNGGRDDLMQRRFLEAVLRTFDPDHGATLTDNPESSVYGGRMIDPSAIHLWTWDARPYPVFPAALDVWSDGENWQTGHWLTGRLDSAPLDALVAAILADAGIGDVDTGDLRDSVSGYVIDRPMSPRAAIEPLGLAYAFDAAEISGALSFRARGADPVAELIEDDLALSDDSAPVRLTRAQETELPRQVTIAFTDGGSDYRRAAVASRRLVGGSSRASHADLAVITDDTSAERRAGIWLQDLWAGRDSADFALPPSRLALGSGDIVGLTVAGRRRLLEIRSVTDAEARMVKAQSIDPGVFDVPHATPRMAAPKLPAPVGPVEALLLDLPTLTADEPPVVLRVAVFADPWPGPVAIWRSFDGLTFERVALALAPSIVGETLDVLPAGPTSRWDWASTVRVRLHGGALASATDTQVLNGANVAAVQRPDGAWEVLQFANAQLVDERTYELSRLLRGQMGSEWAMAETLAAGAPFVLLDRRVITLARGVETIGHPMQLRIIAADRSHGDAAATAVDAVPQTTALKPLAPVHVAARRTDDGVELSWRRRKRGPMPASWDVAVPLGEAGEGYALDILSGASVVRTLQAATPSALYAAADEINDFGSPQASLTVRLHQLSATVGRGIPTEVTLTP